MNNYKQFLGSVGEQMALAFLKEKGYEVLHKNWRCALGELDLVARDRGTLVFVEIKSRTGLGFGSAEEAVNRRKQRTMVRLAQAYLKANRVKDVQARFDVVAVTPEGPKLIQDAFWAESWVV